MPKLTPHQQFKNEHRALLNRWLEESDIDDEEMAQIALNGCTGMDGRGSN